MEKVCDLLGVNCMVFLASDHDFFRKPSPGMFHFLQSHVSYPLTEENAFYCGDRYTRIFAFPSFFTSSRVGDDRSLLRPQQRHPLLHSGVHVSGSLHSPSDCFPAAQSGHRFPSHRGEQPSGYPRAPRGRQALSGAGSAFRRARLREIDAVCDLFQRVSVGESLHSETLHEMLRNRRVLAEEKAIGGRG